VSATLFSFSLVSLGMAIFKGNYLYINTKNLGAAKMQKFKETKK